MSERACKTCGKIFDGRPGQMYCSTACRKRAVRISNRNSALSIIAQANGMSLEEYQRRHEPREKTKTLDKKLEELTASGTSYADAQRAESIERWARIEVPSAPPKEPERPAEEDMIDTKEREALIRIQTMAETLAAFFRSIDDYPGVIVERIAEAAKELLEDEHEHTD